METGGGCAGGCWVRMLFSEVGFLVWSQGGRGVGVAVSRAITADGGAGMVGRCGGTQGSRIVWSWMEGRWVGR